MILIPTFLSSLSFPKSFLESLNVIGLPFVAKSSLWFFLILYHNYHFPFSYLCQYLISLILLVVVSLSLSLPLSLTHLSDSLRLSENLGSNLWIHGICEGKIQISGLFCNANNSGRGLHVPYIASWHHWWWLRSQLEEKDNNTINKKNHSQ